MKAIFDSGQVDELQLFVKSFVSPEAKERMLALLSTRKGQKTFFRELDHFRWLDPRFATLVPQDQQTIRDVLGMLCAKGAPRQCLVISTNPKINGRMLLIGDAVSEVVAGGAGTIILCLPGRLAYYESEEPLERYVCERANSPTGLPIRPR